jgi:hypothetical protein
MMSRLAVSGPWSQMLRYNACHPKVEAEKRARRLVAETRDEDFLFHNP